VSDFEWHCDEIVAQADLFADHLNGVDTRAESPPPDTALRDLSAVTDEDPEEVGTALRAAAVDLAGTLRQTGPTAQMWCPVPGGGSAFLARRFAHETAIHRADAALALGIDFVLPSVVAADGVEEWLDLGCMPFHFEVHPWMRDLLGPGRTIGLHGTDTGDAWLLDFTGDAIAWRRGAEHPAAELRGPVTDVLLMLYRRLPVTAVEIGGDAAMVDFWMERVAFS